VEHRPGVQPLTKADDGPKHLDLLRSVGIEGNIRTEIVALSPEHPYLRPPLHFATSLEERLLSLVTADEPAELRNDAEDELHEPGGWGTTFTLVQCRRRCTTTSEVERRSWR
jgi:hypothetical protein